MNHFLYKHISEPRYDQERYQLIKEQYMHFCPHCYSRLWGIWQFNEEVWPHYAGPSAVLTFHRGYVGGWLMDCKDTLPYHNEFVSFINMKKCPVCNNQLSPDNLYCFFDSYQRCKPPAKAVKSHQNYPITQLSSLNPTINFSTLPKDVSVLVATPGGIAPGLCQMSPDSENTICIQRYDPKCWESAVNFIDDSFTAFAKSKGIEKANERIAEYKSIEVSNTHYRIENAEQLKQFLSVLIGIEKDFYILSERLKTLYAEEWIEDKLVMVEQQHDLADHQRELKKIAASAKRQKNILQKMREDDPTEMITIDQIQLLLPPAPIAPEKPLEPILKKAGLFNKKRIMLENSTIVETYKNECACYEENTKKYNQALADYNECVTQLKEKQKREYEELLVEKRQYHQKLIAQQEDKCKKADIALADARNKNFVLSGPETIAQKSIKNEIHQAEKLLQKICSVRQEMYNSGVIFHKYQNLVAVSSFYEYLSAGRCTSLDGVNGAYNLYESEIQFNTIVSQLSQVIEHLQAIEHNQFVLYTAIAEANGQLCKLNESMEAMNNALAKIDKKLTNIDQKAEVIAYNTEVTAYYSKKNAELTDALGYLIALT